MSARPQADADAVRVAVVAETARRLCRRAFPPRSGSRSHEHIVDLLDSSLALTERRHQVGLATGARHRPHRRPARPAAGGDSAVSRRSVEAALFRLATLTGRAPRELPPRGCRADDLAASRPADSGRRRRRAARAAARRSRCRAAAGCATARIGVATADLYPHDHARRLDRVERRRTRQCVQRQSADLAGRAADQLVLPNRSAARARVAGAEADTQAALATFDGTVLQALAGDRNGAVQLSAGARAPRRAACRARPGREGRPDHARAAAGGRHQLARAARCRAHRSPKPKPHLAEADARIADRPGRPFQGAWRRLAGLRVAIGIRQLLPRGS